MNVEKSLLPGVAIIRENRYEDERGYFNVVFEKSKFLDNGIEVNPIQLNHSRSKFGVIRGIHFQKGECAQAKLVKVIRGKIFDVVVDLRISSKTFGKWFGIELSEEDNIMLFVPRGFGHGFSVLSEEADVIYLVDNKYCPDREGGIIYNDSTLNIDWKIKHPIVSEKDKKWPTLKEALERGDLFEE